MAVPLTFCLFDLLYSIAFIVEGRNDDIMMKTLVMDGTILHYFHHQVVIALE